jgi:hypothetical protein
MIKLNTLLATGNNTTSFKLPAWVRASKSDSLSRSDMITIPTGSNLYLQLQVQLWFHIVESWKRLSWLWTSSESFMLKFEIVPLKTKSWTVNLWTWTSKTASESLEPECRVPPSQVTHCKDSLPVPLRPRPRGDHHESVSLTESHCQHVQSARQWNYGGGIMTACIDWMWIGNLDPHSKNWK